MGRIISWLVVIFLVLLALRVVALRKSRTQRRTAAEVAPQPMVRCARCGVFLPRAEAQETGGGFVCAGGGCVPHG